MLLYKYGFLLNKMKYFNNKKISRNKYLSEKLVFFGKVV